jgi:hypothetical protein
MIQYGLSVTQQRPYTVLGDVVVFYFCFRTKRARVLCRSRSPLEPRGREAAPASMLCAHTAAKNHQTERALPAGCYTPPSSSSAWLTRTCTRVAAAVRRRCVCTHVPAGAPCCCFVRVLSVVREQKPVLHAAFLLAAALPRARRRAAADLSWYAALRGGTARHSAALRCAAPRVTALSQSVARCSCLRSRGRAPSRPAVMPHRMVRQRARAWPVPSFSSPYTDTTPWRHSPNARTPPPQATRASTACAADADASARRPRRTAAAAALAALLPGRVIK